MARIAVADAGGPNVCAFLDALAFSEGTAAHGDDGYNVLVGGDLFDGYADHPRTLVWLPRYQVYSTAAGRYQILAHIWDNLRDMLGLPDFSPVSQDRAAIELIREKRAIADLQNGHLTQAAAKCAHVWASLPGAGYGQREVELAAIQSAYTRAGGTVA